MEHLPIFLSLRGRNALVVGGGAIAARKADLLLKSGARVTVVAPVLSPPWKDLAARVTYLPARYEPAHLDGMDIVIGATDDEAVNAAVGRDAQARHIPVNIVDRPELGSFIMPAIVDRAPVTIAVSTGGAAPVLARLLRARIETLIPMAFGRLARLAERYRERVKACLPDVDGRRRFWEDVFGGEVAAHVMAGRETQAEAALAARLDGQAPSTAGEVYLVGTGPGDPQLLTFRALQLMQQADVILHDQLVPEAVLDLARRDAERVPVGKKGGGARTPQDEINALLVKLAKAGRRVCRLKGGDPYVFGRGGEEAVALVEAGIPFEVVPGITAANGCAASAGIPLTHRGLARSVRFVTGHCRPDDDIADQLDWSSLAKGNQTVVFYMGLFCLSAIRERLVAHGRAGTTPVAVIEKGTLAGQRVITGVLADIVERSAAAGIGSPALIVVGEVVSLREVIATVHERSNSSNSSGGTGLENRYPWA